MQEKPTPTHERTPVDETEVVAKLHLNHDKVVSGEIPASEKLLTEIRNDLSRLECYPMYREYAAGNVPTLAILTESATRASLTIETLLSQDRAKGVPDKELEEETKIKNLLAGRPNSIKRGVESYVRSIIRFHTLKQLSHGGGRDMQTQFVKADEDRRRVHNALLESLKIFTTTVRNAEKEGLLPAGSVVEWTHGMQAQVLIENPDMIVVFAEKIISNEDRDYMKDWAIAADFDLQLKEMLVAQNTPHKEQQEK